MSSPWCSTKKSFWCAPLYTLVVIQQRVAALAQGRYGGINHTQLTELLAEREGVILSTMLRQKDRTRPPERLPRHSSPAPLRSRSDRWLGFDPLHHHLLDSIHSHQWKAVGCVPALGEKNG